MKRLLLLGVVLALVACGAPEEKLRVRSTAFDPAEVLKAYDQENNRINKAYDAAGIEGVEAEPMRIFSNSWMKIKQQLGQPIQPMTHTQPTFLVPQIPDYPRWFVSVSTRVRGTVPGAKQTYTVFVQAAENAPWLVTFANTPAERVPTAREEAVTGFGDLLLAPDALPEAIFKYYTAPSGGGPLARTPVLEEQLASGYRVGTEMMASKGWTLSRTLDAKRFPHFALRTEDGGALVFVANVVTDVTAGPGPVTMEPGSNEAALAGQPQGFTGNGKITVQRLQTFVVHVPVRTANQQARVLAYNDTPIAIS